MSTTVNAGNIDNYPYKRFIIYQNGSTYTYALIISDQNIKTNSAISGYYVTDLNTGLSSAVGSSTSYNYYFSTTTDAHAYILTYNDINGWNISLPGYCSKSNILVLYINDSNVKSYTDAPAGFPTVNIPSIDSILDQMDTKLDNILNATTSTTTEANKIQNNLANSYNDYQNGNISSDQMQQNVTSARDQLNNLNNNANNTLADLIAINNGLTYADTVQDVVNANNIIETQKPSANVTNTITGKLNEANKIQKQYTAGDIKQSEAVTVINQYVTQLTQLITPESTTADITAINTAVSTINGIRDSIAHDSDMDSDVSDKSQEHDKSDLDYISKLDQGYTADDLSVSDQYGQSSNYASQMGDLLSVIWDNELLKLIIPISAIMVVISVVLGRRYRL